MATQNNIGAALKTFFVTSLTEYSAYDATRPDLGDLEGVGTVRIDQYGRRFRWVKNDDASAARAGAPCCYDETDVAEKTFLKYVAVDDIAAGDLKYFAGLWMSAVPAAGFGWIITHGVYDTARVAVVSGGTVVAGNILIPNASTDTAGTAASKPYSLYAIMVQGLTLATAAGQIDAMMDPKCIAMDAITAGSDDSTVTVPSTTSVFVKGLI